MAVIDTCLSCFHSCSSAFFFFFGHTMARILYLNKIRCCYSPCFSGPLWSGPSHLTGLISKPRSHIPFTFLIITWRIYFFGSFPCFAYFVSFTWYSLPCFRFPKRESGHKWLLCWNLWLHSFLPKHCNFLISIGKKHSVTFTTTKSLYLQHTLNLLFLESR